MKHGWLILNKPYGITSMQALARAKRLIGERKAGHAGTLDRLAQGVLPIAFGEATKLIDHVMDTKKTYHFVVNWGEERDTDDRDGEVVKTSDKIPTEAEINHILHQFKGDIQQYPPLYSALKKEGERYSDLARKGIEVEIAARPVHIFRLDLVDHKGVESCFEAEVSKGTYVRSLARDMGRLLGCYGHVSELHRIAVGSHVIANAISLETLEQASEDQRATYLLPLETVLDDILALALTAEEGIRFRHGQARNLAEHTKDCSLCVVKCEGAVLGLGHVQDNVLIPKRIFNL